MPRHQVCVRIAAVIRGYGFASCVTLSRIAVQDLWNFVEILCLGRREFLFVLRTKTVKIAIKTQQEPRVINGWRPLETLKVEDLTRGIQLKFTTFAVKTST